MFHPVFLFEAGVSESVRVSIDGRPLAAQNLATGRTRNGETIVFLDAVARPGATLSFDFN